MSGAVQCGECLEVSEEDWLSIDIDKELSATR